MPEGPSIVILREQTLDFIGQEVLKVRGNTKKINVSIIEYKVVRDIKSWGKHFLICFDQFTIKIHFLLFGTYRINEEKESEPRLSLQFKGGKMNFYGCSIQILEEPLDQIYDWSADVMSEDWDSKSAIKKLVNHPNMLVCDALLDQNIFSGVGNIIKNEVLFRCKIHPESLLGKIPTAKLKELLAETKNYSFEFLKWKKEYTLKKHWLAHTKTVCSRDDIPLLKKYLGTSNRRTFYCEKCQKLYN